mgnify:CR=1 FL=1
MRRFIVILFAVLLLPLFSALAHEYPCEGIANASNVRVRKKASSSGAQVLTLKKGEAVQITEETVKQNGDIWYKVETAKGKTGYVLGDYLSIPETALIEAAESSENAVMMKLTAKAYCSDYNSVGKNWTQYYEWNGIQAQDGKAEAWVAPDVELIVYSRVREQDQKPDTTMETTSYTPTADDMENGFTITQEIKVTENNGKYKDHSAYWTVTFTFEPATE